MAMHLRRYQTVLAGIWILAISVAAIAAGVRSVSTFAFVAVVAVLPLVVMQLLWHDPPETMSESIHQARRR